MKKPVRKSGLFLRSAFEKAQGLFEDSFGTDEEQTSVVVAVHFAAGLAGQIWAQFVVERRRQFPGRAGGAGDDDAGGADSRGHVARRRAVADEQGRFGYAGG